MAVKLFSAPPLEPPFDDQRAPDDWPMPPEAGAQLALRWRSAAATPSVATCPGRSTFDRPDQLTTGTSQAAWHASLLFLGRCQEILNGYRPAAQVRPLAAPASAQAIVEELTAVARRTVRLPGAARAAGGRDGQLSRVARRRVHVCEPLPGVAEATAVLTQESRSWAIAFRLERRGTVWLCTNFTDVNQRSADATARP